MGLYSKVVYVCEEKAYDEFFAVIDKYDYRKPEIKRGHSEKVFTIDFDWVKWYFSDMVDEMEKTEKELKENHENEEGYGFKCIRLYEDNTAQEIANNRGYVQFCDLCLVCEIDNPYGE